MKKLKITSDRFLPGKMTNPIDDFTKEINTLIDDAHELLANTIERTRDFFQNFRKKTL